MFKNTSKSIITHAIQYIHFDFLVYIVAEYIQGQRAIYCNTVGRINTSKMTNSIPML